MQINGKVILGENISATGSDIKWQGGKGLFTAVGTFSASSSAILQMIVPAGESSDGSNWVDVYNQSGNKVSLTANGAMPFELPATSLRVKVAGTITGLYSYAIGMHQ